MPADTQCLMDAAAIVAKREGMQVSMKYAIGAGLTNVATSCAGSVAFGPLGMVAGAIVGSVGFMMLTRGRFKSLHHVIEHELSPNEREDLKRLLVEAFRDFSLEDGLTMVKTGLDLLYNKKAYNVIYNVLMQFALKYYKSIQRNPNANAVSTYCR